jgi:hypothetical protein
MEVHQMAMKIILTDDEGNQEEILMDTEINDHSWEEDCYQIGCMIAKNIGKWYLKNKDDEILSERPSSLQVKEIQERTLVTRFGDITVNRRYYQDADGTYHYLLDEYLSWRPYQSATPSLTEALVESATGSTFRRVSREVEKYTAGVISASTVHRLLQEVTQDAIDSEKQEWKSCFEDGSIPPPGDRKVDVLYTEADGIYINLQQEDQEHYELKNAIAYEGWEPIPGGEERYELVGKKVYSHGDDSIPFWDGAGLEWNRWWDLGYAKLIVVGGDDANWIDKGTDELGFSVRQLSGFHLARSCRQGWENGDDMYAAIRSGRVRQTLGKLAEREGKTAEKARKYVLERLEKGADWREKVVEYEVRADFMIPETARGLGAIEGNEANLFSDRMKDRGMSWTIKGAQHMGKAIELASNGELSRWCGRMSSDNQSNPLCFDLFDELDGNGKRIATPALEGTHANRPWAMALRNMTSAYNPLN